MRSIATLFLLSALCLTLSSNNCPYAGKGKGGSLLSLESHLKSNEVILCTCPCQQQDKKTRIKHKRPFNPNKIYKKVRKEFA